MTGCSVEFDCLMSMTLRWVWVCLSEPAFEMTEEEKEMMNIMGFCAFSTTKVLNCLHLFVSTDLN